MPSVVGEEAGEKMPSANGYSGDGPDAPPAAEASSVVIVDGGSDHVEFPDGEAQVLQSIDTNSIEEAVLKNLKELKPPVVSVTPAPSSSSSDLADFLPNGFPPPPVGKENNSTDSPSTSTCGSDGDTNGSSPPVLVAAPVGEGAPVEVIPDLASVEIKECRVEIEELPLEFFKECVRAYAEIEEPLDSCSPSLNPHQLNVEHLSLAELGICLRRDENSAASRSTTGAEDWLADEAFLPVRPSTAKRIWRTGSFEDNNTGVASVGGQAKKRCVAKIPDEFYVWERSQPGFFAAEAESGQLPPAKAAESSVVSCAKTVKRKYECMGYAGPRKVRTITGKVNGISKLAGGVPSKRSSRKNLARDLTSDGYHFTGRRNKVLAVAAEILGEVATTASEDGNKGDDEEMPSSAGSEAMVDEQTYVPVKVSEIDGSEFLKETLVPQEDLREQGGAAAAAVSSSSPAGLAKVGSATSSVQGVSLSSLSKTVSQSQGSVRQLSLVELARLQGVVQKGSLGRPRGLRPSLFSNVPPTINFALHNTHAEEVPPFLKKHLRWKLSNLTPLVVRKVLGHSNLRLMKSDSTEWIGHWGKHMKAIMFKDFKAYQKINHFPGTFVIGRKDRLWKGFAQFRSKFGKNEFNFLPRTYILPADLRELKESMDRKGSRAQNYIVKPPASARGTGVYVVNNYSQINAERQLVVQKYITRPFLINGTKFDLRLYIFVASFNPLRLYLYRDGLVRFASEKYNSSSRTLNHQFVHLTNYSINRKSGNYQANNNINECQGHKWTLLAFWKFLRRLGVNTGLLWASIQDIVIKTILTSESTVNDMMERHVRSRYSTFELFGFDIILDETLKPWLLEVNISPSLHSSSSLDEDVKGRMLRDLFNLMMLHIPSGKLNKEEEREIVRQCRLPPDTPIAHDPVLYTDELSRTERNKHDYYQTKNRRKDYLRTILSELTPDDIRQLIVAEDELARCGDYVRIFPTQYTYLYHRFFEKPRYYNLLLDAWEFHYHSDRLAGRLLLEHYCSKKHHVQFRKDVSYRRIHVQVPQRETSAQALRAEPDEVTNSASSNPNLVQASEDDAESSESKQSDT